MKKMIGILGLIAAGFTTYAQQPAPDPDTLKNPVKQIDPEVKQPPADIHYVDDMPRIAATDLPPIVLDSLKKREPVNWEKSVVYHDKRNNSYVVEVRNAGQEKTYRFDTKGNQDKTSKKEKQ